MRKVQSPGGAALGGGDKKEQGTTMEAVQTGKVVHCGGASSAVRSREESPNVAEAAECAGLAMSDRGVYATPTRILPEGASVGSGGEGNGIEDPTSLPKEVQQQQASSPSKKPKTSHFTSPSSVMDKLDGSPSPKRPALDLTDQNAVGRPSPSSSHSSFEDELFPFDTKPFPLSAQNAVPPGLGLPPVFGGASHNDNVPDTNTDPNHPPEVIRKNRVPSGLMERPKDPVALLLAQVKENVGMSSTQLVGKSSPGGTETLHHQVGASPTISETKPLHHEKNERTPLMQRSAPHIPFLHESKLKKDLNKSEGFAELRYLISRPDGDSVRRTAASSAGLGAVSIPPSEGASVRGSYRLRYSPKRLTVERGEISSPQRDAYSLSCVSEQKHPNTGRLQDGGSQSAPASSSVEKSPTQQDIQPTKMLSPTPSTVLPLFTVDPEVCGAESGDVERIRPFASTHQPPDGENGSKPDHETVRDAPVPTSSRKTYGEKDRRLGGDEFVPSSDQSLDLRQPKADVDQHGAAQSADITAQLDLREPKADVGQHGSTQSADFTGQPQTSTQLGLSGRDIVADISGKFVLPSSSDDTHSQPAHSPGSSQSLGRNSGKLGDDVPLFHREQKISSPFCSSFGCFSPYSRVAFWDVH